MSTIHSKTEAEMWDQIDEEISERHEELLVNEDERVQRFLTQDGGPSGANLITFRLAGGEDEDAVGWLQGFQDNAEWQYGRQRNADGMGLRWLTQARFVGAALARAAVTLTSRAGNGYNPTALSQGSVSEALQTLDSAWEFIPPKGSTAATKHWMFVEFSPFKTDDLGRLELDGDHKPIPVPVPRLKSDGTQVQASVEKWREMGFTGFVLEFSVRYEDSRPGRSPMTIAGQEVWRDDPSRPRKVVWGEWVAPDTDEMEYRTPLVRYRMFRQMGQAKLERRRFVAACRAIREAASIEVDETNREPGAKPNQEVEFDDIVG